MYLLTMFYFLWYCLEIITFRLYPALFTICILLLFESHLFRYLYANVYIGTLAHLCFKSHGVRYKGTEFCVRAVFLS